MSEKIDYSKGVYDARQLGAGRMFILGVQHMFAMFGATVLVPLLTGLSVSTTLLCAGLGTLLFHLITKKKVPAFLGSSFAYLGGFSIVAPMLADADGNLTVANTKMLPYACAAVAFSGLVYLAASLLISTFGIRRIMRFFPPVVTGPIIISIGLILAPSAITNCQANWLLAIVALGVVVVCNIWGKGMVKILPILIGVLVSYAVALVTGAVDFQKIADAAWLGIPLHKEAMGLFAIDGSPEFISALFTIIPIALATMMEHVGDIAAISATVGHNYINDPGLNRTLLGDGLATTMAGLLGGPANTTYGENTGVLALSKIYDPLVIRIAAVLALQGYRLDDLMRWGGAKVIVNKRGRGAYLGKDAVLYKSFTEEQQSKLTTILTDGSQWMDPLQELLPNGYQFVAGRDYLLPIPPSELKLNRQMKQNPGWGEE